MYIYYRYKLYALYFLEITRTILNLPSAIFWSGHLSWTHSALHQNVLVLAALARVKKRQRVDRLQESSTRLSSEKKVHIMRIRRIWEVLNLISKKQNNHCVSSPNKRSSISLKTNHFPLYSKSAAASVDRGWRSTYVCTMAMVFCTKCLPCYHALQM